jgi:adenylate kinase family enzyme
VATHIKHDKTAVIYVGRPKSGKGTQTDALQTRGELVFATGNWLRSLPPDHPVAEIMARGQLVDDSTIIWETKKWILAQIKRNSSHLTIHLDGVPRNIDQLTVTDLLIDRGYTIKLVEFTTPEDVCLSRIRAGRTDDGSIKERMRVYDQYTAPMAHEMIRRYNLHPDNGTLLSIDNTHLEPAETSAQLIAFIGLKLRPHDLFPESKKPALTLGTGSHGFLDNNPFERTFFGGGTATA